MEDVRVHYDSDLPARVEALAFAQGNDIHLAPGQEEHLAHEAWHVAQQKQGRVRANLRLEGAAINEESGLEREAEVMGRRARDGGSNSDKPGFNARPADKGFFAAQIPKVGPNATARAFSAPSPFVNGSFAPAPIQRVKWRWDAASQSWNPVGGASASAVPPAHQGAADGDVWDDKYRQDEDPTVQPFLRPGESFMGERGARKQLAGSAPKAEDIRVPAVGGAGLHEIDPTSRRGEVAASGNPVAVGVQSGMRSGTDHQLFRRKAGKGEAAAAGAPEVGAHTGFARKPGGGHGSTHLKGQGPAHDEMRKAARAAQSHTDPADAVIAMARAHLDVTPAGDEVLGSEYLTGMVPLDPAIGPVGPPAAAGAPPDPARLALARREHRERERVKKRVRSLKRKTGRGSSPSPEREDIDNLGGGGGPAASARPLSPVPEFDGVDDFEIAANMGAWVTAPQRSGFPYPPAPAVAAAVGPPPPPPPPPPPAAAAAPAAVAAAPAAATTKKPAKKKAKKKGGSS